MTEAAAPDPSDSPSVASAVVTEPTDGPVAPSVFGVPLAMFMRGGGTTSSGHDRMVAEAEADAERRRDIAAAERDKTGQGARIYAHQFTDHPDVTKAYVLLEYVTPRGEPLFDHGARVQCLADVLYVSPTELALVLVCPSCKERMPQGQCQIRVLQSNRSWHLDTRRAGEMFEFDGHIYRSAGRIMDSDVLPCPQCAWRVRIDDNRVWPV